jgi:hypothetical protein
VLESEVGKPGLLPGNIQNNVCNLNDIKTYTE